MIGRDRSEGRDARVHGDCKAWRVSWARIKGTLGRHASVVMRMRKERARTAFASEITIEKGHCVGSPGKAATATASTLTNDGATEAAAEEAARAAAAATMAASAAASAAASVAASAAAAAAGGGSTVARGWRWQRW